MKFIYYNISGNWHCGEGAIDQHLPNANDLDSADLAREGWEKASVPDDWTSIYCQYKNNQLIVRPDAPPYWDNLGQGLITNSLFQRLQSLRYSSPAINVSMAQISEVIGIGKNQISLAYTVMGLRSILVSINSPITPQEITETEALLVGCGFEPSFFTYAQNVVNPPTPPLI